MSVCLLNVFYCLRHSWKSDVLSNEWPLEIKFFIIIIIYYYYYYYYYYYLLADDLCKRVETTIIPNR